MKNRILRLPSVFIYETFITIHKMHIKLITHSEVEHSYDTQQANELIAFRSRFAITQQHAAFEYL